MTGWLDRNILALAWVCGMASGLAAVQVFW